MRVAVIVVNYNQAGLLDKCLSSLEKVQYEKFKVYVVDNGSTDISLSMLKNKVLDVEAIQMGYNSGFCIANNRGMKRALKERYDAILLLNNDTEVQPDCIAKMVEALSPKELVGMISAKVILLNEPECLDSAGLEITPDGYSKNTGFRQPSESFQTARETFCPAGAAALYSRELLEDIREGDEFFDEDFGYYFEELDLGWRARLKGWKCAYCPDAVVYHHKSASAGAYSEFVAFYTNRNIYYNIIKNYPGMYMWKALLLSLARYPALVMGAFVGQGNGDKLARNMGLAKLSKVTILGLAQVASMLPKLLRKRIRIQKSRRVGQEEIRRWFRELGITFRKAIFY